MKSAWNEEHGRWHIVRTLGLEPWELYKGDYEDERAHMRTLLKISDQFAQLIESAIADGVIEPSNGGLRRADENEDRNTNWHLPRGAVKRFREYLNSQDVEGTSKHRNYRYKQRSRKYGDYLYSQDRDKFFVELRANLDSPNVGSELPTKNL